MWIPELCSLGSQCENPGRAGGQAGVHKQLAGQGVSGYGGKRVQRGCLVGKGPMAFSPPSAARFSVAFLYRPWACCPFCPPGGPTGAPIQLPPCFPAEQVLLLPQHLQPSPSAHLLPLGQGSLWPLCAQADGQ